MSQNKSIIGRAVEMSAKKGDDASSNASASGSAASSPAPVSAEESSRVLKNRAGESRSPYVSSTFVI